LKPICAPMMRSMVTDSCHSCPFRDSCPAFRAIKELEAELEELAGAFEEL